MTAKNENRVTAPAARKDLPVRPDVRKKVDIDTMRRYIAKAEATYGGWKVEERIIDRNLETCRRYVPIVAYVPDTGEWRWSVWRYPVGTSARPDAYKAMVANGSTKTEELTRVSARYAAEQIYARSTRPKPVKMAEPKKTGIMWVPA